ncbi:hypothetical protein BGZ76_003533 [Entomortierella beljakovae]|nr:hypothetical protein BGZ76_003533 [Entomortierella beljakovae]
MDGSRKRQRIIDKLVDLQMLARLFDEESLEEFAREIYIEYHRKHVKRYKEPSSAYPNIFPDLSESEFRLKFRTSKRGFRHILDVIKDHPVFKNQAKFKQVDPMYQLAVALYRFGSGEDDISIKKVKTEFGIGAGTVSTYFSPGEYLITDSAYGLTKHTIPQFKATATIEPQNREFNYCLERSNVRIKNCIAKLKSRWASLQKMRQQLRSEGDKKILCGWVIACCVLYNMLNYFDDEWEGKYDDGPDVDDSKCPTPEKGRLAGEEFRKALMKTTVY